MRIMGRSRGRARTRELDKAFSAGAAAGFAGANRSAQPRTRSLVGLADAINAATGATGSVDSGVYRMVDMLRDPRDDVAFGPSHPLSPAPIDPVRPDTSRPEPRLSEYPVSWNLPGSADQAVPWATLRAAADSVDIMRRCISVRKEQLQGLDWSITLDDQVVQSAYAADTGNSGREDVESEMRRRLLPEIERLTTFWRNPWKANGVSFEQWVNAVMEDHLVIDGVAIYPRMTYGGELSAFELIDPTTIKLLIDYRGARPEPPFPAFQQVLYGFPRAEFASCYAEDGSPVEGLGADQLWYFREEYRSFTPYGYSAVQQALISARLYLKRQGWMLAEYDDGSTPLTFLVPDATDGTLVEKLTPRTRQQWEDSINAQYAGQTRQRHRMKVLQPGMKPVPMQGVDERYKPDYDMHLIKMLAGHFGVTSSGLGFSESKGLGNSGLHEGQERVQDSGTTKPDKRMIERIVNELMCTYQGAPAELRFKFSDPEAEDREAEDTAAGAQRERGTITLNDDRKRLGKAPLPFAEADMALVKVGDGWMPLEGMAKRAEQAAEAEQALVEDQLANSEHARGVAEAEAEMPAEDIAKAAEVAVMARWRRKLGGRPARRPFMCKALEPGDFTGGVPADVEFEAWAWVPDGLPDDATDDMIVGVLSYDLLEKGFGQGNDNWRTLARDHRGRWVARGRMRVDALGPATPDKPVLAGLAAEAKRRRSIAANPFSAVGAATSGTASQNARGAVSGQLRANDASSTMGGMTSPTGKPKRQTAAQRKEQAFRDELARLSMLNPYERRGEDAVRADIAGRDAAKLGADIGFMREHLRKQGVDHQTDAQRERSAAEHAATVADSQARQAARLEREAAERAERNASITSAQVAAQARYDGAESVRGGDEGQREAAALARRNAADGIDVAASRARFGRRDARTAEQKRLEVLADKREQAQARFEGAQRESARLDRAARDAGGDDLAANARRDAALAEERRLKDVFYAAQDAERDAKSAAQQPTPPVEDVPVKLTSAQHHVLSTWRTSSAGYLIADRRVMPALERAGLAEQVRTEKYGTQWVATDAGRAALERADADWRAELDAQAMAKLTPEQRERVARIDETARRVQAERAKPAAAPSPSAPDAAGARSAYAELSAANGGNPVGLAELRARMGGTREQQDRTLRELAGNPDVAFFPEENQKTLTEADRAAAIVVGGEPRHLLHIDKPQRSVLDTVRESSEAAARASAVIDSVPGLREGVARQQGQRVTLTGQNDRLGELTVSGTIVGKPVVTGDMAEVTVRTKNGADIPINVPTSALSADDGPVTVREEGRQTNPGFALPTTPPAATRDGRIAAALAEIPEVRQTTRGRGKQAREAFSAAGFLHDTREAAEAARRAEAERLVDREDKAAELDRAAIEAEARNDAEGAALARADRAQMRYEDAQVRTDHLGDLAESLDTDEARARHDAAVAESDRLRAEADAAERAYNAAQRPRLRAEQDAADQRARENLAQLNAERAERERKAAEDAAAEIERKAREREENARRVAEIQAETRAELARRTPEAFALMLDGGDKATTHAPSRKILAEMREQGWVMTHMNGSMMRFEAPDGRGIRMTYGRDRVKWERGDYKGNQTMGESISLTAAAALVGVNRPPARKAEAVAASTPDAPAAPAAPKLSKRQRDMADRFDRLAGEYAADPRVARWRERAIELAGDAERVNRGDEDAPNAWVVNNQMEQVRDEFTHAMAGARAAAAARADGVDERGQAIARTQATLDSRARKVTDRITQLEADVRAMAKPRGALTDPHTEARKKLRKQINDAKAQRQRYLDRIESAERDHDTKLVYDADGKLIGTSYEPPAAPKRNGR